MGSVTTPAPTQAAVPARIAWRVWARPVVGAALAILALSALPAGAASPPRPAKLEQPGLRIEYPPRQKEDALRAAAAARATIRRARAELGLAQVQPITVILYASHQEFARATGTPRRQFIVGIAAGAGGTAQVDASGLASDLATVVSHEVAHLLFAQATNQAPVPLWFNEGYAEHASGSLVASARQILADRLAAGGLLKLSDMEHTFPHEGDAATVAYAQAYDLVTYILDHSHREALPDLVGRLRAGEPFDYALRAVTGRSAAGWDAEWRGDFRGSYRWYTWLVFGLGISGAIMAFLCVLAYRAIKRKKEALPDDLW